MRVHQYEKAFLTAGGIVLVLCLAALAWSTFVMGIHLPGHAGRIDPLAVRSTPPFDQPGVRQTGPGRYQAVVIATAWRFEPAEIRVPAGAVVGVGGVASFSCTRVRAATTNSVPSLIHCSTRASSSRCS
ncbi:MAG: hypothetical protein L0271_25130, partial [Gemmatimonadetes bacterium]|nr:hypothetical protein [Gemmatimonadota bacterium]